MKEFTVYANPDSEEMLCEEELDARIRQELEDDMDAFDDWLKDRYSAVELLMMTPTDSDRIIDNYVEARIEEIHNNWISRTFIIETP